MRNNNPVNYPALLSVILTKDEQGPEIIEKLNYRSVIGLLNFLTNSSTPELAFVVHQCARFCNNLTLIHEQAVKRIIKYLVSTKRNSVNEDGSILYSGLIFLVDKFKSIEVFVDASFSGD